MTDRLTELENDSIRSFLGFAAANGYLSGRVLDYGCGKQPYRGIVEKAGGEYVPFDRGEFPANQVGDVGQDDHANYQRYRTILCTQVVQYVPIEFDTDMGEGLQDLLCWFASLLNWYESTDPPPRTVQYRGHLVMTYPTNWPEVQDVDLHRFTKAGMEDLLTQAGFTILEHVKRASIESHGYEFALGYGVIARA